MPWESLLQGWRSSGERRGGGKRSASWVRLPTDWPGWATPPARPNGRRVGVFAFRGEIVSWGLKGPFLWIEAREKGGEVNLRGLPHRGFSREFMQPSESFGLPPN